MLTQIGSRLQSRWDVEGTLSSTLLVRLSKQAVSMDNNHRHHSSSSVEQQGPPSETTAAWQSSSIGQDWTWEFLENTIHTLTSASWEASSEALDAAVEGTKAASVLARLTTPNRRSSFETWRPLIQKWQTITEKVACDLQPHQLTGLKWSMDCFRCLLDDDVDGEDDATEFLPPHLQRAYDSLDLPFRIRAGSLANIHDLTVSNLAEQVNFQVDTIRTTSKKVVPERRQTAWEGDEGVAPFEYSGKAMLRNSWSPLVKTVREYLKDETGIIYDGCLLNLYPDGGSGMRYHVDPDQGTLWDYHTAVVSVGATRKFALRATTPTTTGKPKGGNKPSRPHIFTLMQGDCTEMFSDCQSRFQHTIKTAETSDDEAPRSSLVFKKTLDQIL